MSIIEALCVQQHKTYDKVSQLIISSSNSVLATLYPRNPAFINHWSTLSLILITLAAYDKRKHFHYMINNT